MLKMTCETWKKHGIRLEKLIDHLVKAQFSLQVIWGFIRD